MRFVVYGAGAIGGVVGGRLAQHGHEVVLIARGDHHDAIRDDGLRLWVPDEETVTLTIPVVSHPAGIDFRDDDVVLLAMKSQHTGKALSALAATAPATIAVVCGAERRGQRARRAPAVRGRVRRVRGVPGAAPRAGGGGGARRADHRDPRHRSLPRGGRRARPTRSPPRSPRRRSSRWRAPTSCGGSTASCSTTSATRSTRSADPIPRPVRCNAGRGRKGRSASPRPGSTR